MPVVTCQQQNGKVPCTEEYGDMHSNYGSAPGKGNESGMRNGGRLAAPQKGPPVRFIHTRGPERRPPIWFPLVARGSTSRYTLTNNNLTPHIVKS